MPTFVLSGKVLPERATLNMTAPTHIKWVKSPTETMKLDVHIYVNQITAIFEHYEDCDFESVCEWVSEYVRFVVNYCGYTMGIGYDVEITSAWRPDTREVRVFGRDLKVIDGEPDQRAAKYFPFMSAVAQSSANLPLIMSDLRAALRYPEDATVHCYRAFESILEEFDVPTGKKSKKGTQTAKLERMGDELNLGSAKTLRDFLGRLAGDRRHGKPVKHAFQDREAAMKRIWVVTDRFVNYLNDGRKPLSPAKFPIPKF